MVPRDRGRIRGNPGFWISLHAPLSHREWQLQQAPSVCLRRSPTIIGVEEEEQRGEHTALWGASGGVLNVRGGAADIHSVSCGPGTPGAAGGAG